MFDVDQALSGFPKDPASVGTDELERAFADLHRLAEAVEARRLRLLAELQRRRTYREDGYRSGATWLASRFRVSASSAKEQVRVATSLGEMPLVRRALEGGDVSVGAVGLLAAAREEHPDAFRKDEPSLVGRACVVGPDELRQVLAEWSQEAAADQGPAGAERLRDRRHLSVCQTPTGMVRVKGELDPESGEAVATALESMVHSELRSSGPADLRTVGQRWADAMTELARRYLDRSDRPTLGGERPHLTVTIGADVLAAGRGAGQLDHAGRIAGEAVRRIACDASVRRVVLAGPSEPLDVGRRTPIVSAAMRRAVIIRDGGCTFPRCDWPPGWTDAHHAVHWADGGPTKLDNLVLLCRQHHRLVHEGGFGLRVEEGRAVFRRPDGSVLEDGRGPPPDG